MVWINLQEVDEMSADPFYSRENIADLERRISDVYSGRSKLQEHELIEDEE